MKKLGTIALWTALLVAAAAFPGTAGTITVDGDPLEGITPVTRDNRTLVPLRSIFEALEAQVKFDPISKEINASKGTIRIKLTLNSPQVEVDGTPLFIDVPPTLIEGKAYVPLRFIGTALGAQVKYYGDTDTIVITTAAPPSPDASASPSAVKVPAGNLTLEHNPTQMTADEYSKALEVIQRVNE